MFAVSSGKLSSSRQLKYKWVCGIYKSSMNRLKIYTTHPGTLL